MLFAGAAGLAAATALPVAAHTAAASQGAQAGQGGQAGQGARVVQPAIDTTAQWGARPPDGTISLVRRRPAALVVHHTVSANTSDFSRAQAHSHARWVQALHQDDNGWVDTGYNFVVSRGGYLTEGRHRSLETLLGGTEFVLGAHTSGANDFAIGISNEGAYHDGAVPPAAQWASLVRLCAYAAAQYAIPATEIYGHKDFGNTLCPGVFHDMLPQLRDEVAAALG
ncbi:N-acetylmuramoyl-L-alanine amidase [Streptomyces radicis]|uniref:N-acetylmuramoyl-L-alanine amidase n=2 Tax=Streptomyces radicis TaxID=1750517 RepID=A0A3A9VWF0_9ACTN|nr:peptidoglycan recognition family protein [Streptomyces radicis]RKN05258.1 N-acetylmuramoyl-L-alanine amidase [Streptomyces radicis]RKN16791.1 N-acetylmuramoyl-L-alanine amidase [Streptomyces radicis]